MTSSKKKSFDYVKYAETLWALILTTAINITICIVLLNYILVSILTEYYISNFFNININYIACSVLIHALGARIRHALIRSII